MSYNQAYNEYWQRQEKKNKRRGTITTIIVHAVILLLFFLFGLAIPYPPPAEQGILINFGTADAGSGMIQPESVERVVEPVPVVQPQPVAAPEVQPEIATQNIEEAPAIIETPTPRLETQPTPAPVPETTQPVESKPEPKVDENMLFPGAPSNQNRDGSEGTTTFEGDQGRPHGERDPGAYTGDRSTGLGDQGVGWDLDGRSRINIPVPRDQSNREGDVVITIQVDREGNVIGAEFRLRGSTIQDPRLRQLAIDAAKKAKFSPKADAPEVQTGTITFRFRNR